MNKNTRFLLSSSSSSKNSSNVDSSTFFFALTQRLLQFTSKVHPKTAAENIVPALVAGRAQMLTKFYQQKEESRSAPLLPSSSASSSASENYSSSSSPINVTTDQLAVINEAITNLSAAALRRALSEGLLVYDTSRFLPLLQLLPLLKRQTQRVEKYRIRDEKRRAWKTDHENHQNEKLDDEASKISSPSRQELKKIASNFVDYALTVQSPDFALYVLRALYDEDVLSQELLMMVNPSSLSTSSASFHQKKIQAEKNNNNNDNHKLSSSPIANDTNNIISESLTLINKPQFHKLVASVVEKTNRIYSLQPYLKRVVIGELFSILMLSRDEQHQLKVLDNNNKKNNAEDNLEEEEEDSSIASNQQHQQQRYERFQMKIIEPIKSLSSKSNNSTSNKNDSSSLVTTKTTTAFYIENFINWWRGGGASTATSSPARFRDNFPLSPTLETDLSILAKRSMATLTQIKNNMAMQKSSSSLPSAINNNNSIDKNIEHEFLWNQHMPKNYILGLLLFLNERRAMEDVLKYFRWQLERKGFGHVYYLDQNEREKAILLRDEVKMQAMEKERKKTQMESLLRQQQQKQPQGEEKHLEKENGNKNDHDHDDGKNIQPTSTTTSTSSFTPRLHLSQVHIRAAVILSLRIARLAKSVPDEFVQSELQKIRQKRETASVSKTDEATKNNSNNNNNDNEEEIDDNDDENPENEIDDNHNSNEDHISEQQQRQQETTWNASENINHQASYDLIRGTTDAAIIAQMLSLWIDLVKSMIYLDKQQQQQQQQEHHHVREFLSEINPRTLSPIMHVLKFYSSPKHQHVLRNTNAFHRLRVTARFEHVLKHFLEHFSHDFVAVTELACLHFGSAGKADANGNSWSPSRVNFLSPREFFRVFDSLEAHASKLANLEPLSREYRSNNNVTATNSTTTSTVKLPIEDRKMLQRFFRKSYVLGFLSKGIDVGYLRFSVDENQLRQMCIAVPSQTFLFSSSSKLQQKNSAATDDDDDDNLAAKLREEEHRAYARIEIRKRKMTRILQVVAEQLILCSNTEFSKLIIVTKNSNNSKNNTDHEGVNQQESSSSSISASSLLMTAPLTKRNIFKRSGDFDRFIKFFLKLPMEAPTLCYYILAVGVHEALDSSSSSSINNAANEKEAEQQHHVDEDEDYVNEQQQEQNHHQHHHLSSPSNNSSTIPLHTSHTLILENLGKYMHVIGIGMHNTNHQQEKNNSLHHSSSSSSSSGMKSNNNPYNNNNDVSESRQGIEIKSYKLNQHQIQQFHVHPLLSHQSIHKQLRDSYQILNLRMEEVFKLRSQFLALDANVNNRNKNKTANTDHEHVDDDDEKRRTTRNFYENYERELVKEGFSLVALIEYMHGHHIADISLPGRALHRTIGPYLIHRITTHKNHNNNMIGVEFGRKLLLHEKIKRRLLLATNLNEDSFSGNNTRNLQEQLRHHTFITRYSANHHELLTTFSKIIIPVITRGFLRSLTRPSNPNVAVRDVLRAFDQERRAAANHHHPHHHSVTSASIYKFFTDTVVDLFSRRSPPESNPSLDHHHSQNELLEKSDLMYQVYRQYSIEANREVSTSSLSGKNTPLHYFLEKQLKILTNENIDERQTDQTHHQYNLLRNLESNFLSRWNEQLRTSTQLLEDLATRFIFSQFLLHRARIDMENAIAEFVSSSLRQTMKIRRQIYLEQVKRNDASSYRHHQQQKTIKNDGSSSTNEHEDESTRVQRTDDHDDDVDPDGDHYQDEWNSSSTTSTTTTNATDDKKEFSKIDKYNHLAFSASSLSATQNNLLLLQQIESARMFELYRPQTLTIKHLLKLCLGIHGAIENSRFENVTTTTTTTRTESSVIKTSSSVISGDYNENHLSSSSSLSSASSATAATDRFSSAAHDRERAQIVEADLKLREHFAKFFQAAKKNSSSGTKNQDDKKTTETEIRTKRIFHLARFRLRASLKLLTFALTLPISSSTNINNSKNNNEDDSFIASNSEEQLGSLSEVISFLPAFKLHQIVLLQIQYCLSTDDVDQAIMKQYYRRKEKEDNGDDKNKTTAVDDDETKKEGNDDDDSNSVDARPLLLLLPSLRQHLEISIAILQKIPVSIVNEKSKSWKKEVENSSSSSNWVADVVSASKKNDESENLNDDKDFSKQNDDEKERDMPLVDANGMTTSFSLSIMQHFHEMKPLILQKINVICEAMIYAQKDDASISSLKKQKDDLINLLETLEKLVPKP